jgi:hypothetical protein
LAALDHPRKNGIFVFCMVTLPKQKFAILLKKEINTKKQRRYKHEVLET